jgi:DNA-binding response OmpR family regulator
MTHALRVLVVEDEMMIAMLMEDMLQDLGYETVGPARRLESGMKIAGSEQIDLAILDINLGGAQSFPIAALLVARGIPVILRLATA